MNKPSEENPELYKRFSDLWDLEHSLPRKKRKGLIGAMFVAATIKDVEQVILEYEQKYSY